MAYDPGTLLTVKPEIEKCKVDYFKQWHCPKDLEGITNRYEQYKLYPYQPMRNFKEGDNIFIIDYFGKWRYNNLPNNVYDKEDFFYRVWINGEECFVRDDIIEREDLYGVVK